jgi:hypothetical protein
MTEKISLVFKICLASLAFYFGSHSSALVMMTPQSHSIEAPLVKR